MKYVFMVLPMMLASLAACNESGPVGVNVEDESTVATTMAKGADVIVHSDPRMGGCSIIRVSSRWEGTFTAVYTPQGTCQYQCNAKITEGETPSRAIVQREYFDEPYGFCTIVLTPGGSASWTCADAWVGLCGIIPQ